MSDIEDDDGSMEGDEDEPNDLKELNDFNVPPFYEDEQMDKFKKVRRVLSLKDNCYHSIIKNFDRFNNAFLSSDDAHLCRNLEFLQRVYSSRVIHSLSRKILLRDEHLDFLINEYLKELDLSETLALSRCSLKVLEKRIVLVGNGFTKVSLNLLAHSGGTEFLNATICQLSNVEVLHIPYVCKDTTLENISSFCTKLSELNIDYSSEFTVEGLKMLCKKQEVKQTECLIKILSVRNTMKLDSAITFLLNNMPHLEVLNCKNLPFILHSMHKQDLKNNTLNSVKKYNLTKLDFLNSSHILLNDLKTEVLHVCAEVCPNIKTLYINFSTEDCLNLIFLFTNLEDLIVGCENPIDFNIFLKSNGIKLRNLQISGFVLSVPILIRSCPKLQNLVLRDIQFQSLENNLTTGQPSSKQSFHDLIELCLVGIDFSNQCEEDSVTNILSSSPNLIKLSFKHCKFCCVFYSRSYEMNIKLAKICEDSKLQHLRFCDSTLEIALLESILLTCSSLLSLIVDTCGIRSDKVLSLRQLRETAGGFVEISINNWDQSDGDYYYNNEEDEGEDNDDVYSDYEYEGSDVVWYGNEHFTFWGH